MMPYTPMRVSAQTNPPLQSKSVLPTLPTHQKNTHLHLLTLHLTVVLFPSHSTKSTAAGEERRSHTHTRTHAPKNPALPLRPPPYIPAASAVQMLLPHVHSVVHVHAPARPTEVRRGRCRQRPDDVPRPGIGGRRRSDGTLEFVQEHAQSPPFVPGEHGSRSVRGRFHPVLQVQIAVPSAPPRRVRPFLLHFSVVPVVFRAAVRTAPKEEEKGEADPKKERRIWSCSPPPPPVPPWPLRRCGCFSPSIPNRS